MVGLGGSCLLAWDFMLFYAQASPHLAFSLWGERLFARPVSLRSFAVCAIPAMSQKPHASWARICHEQKGDTYTPSVSDLLFYTPRYPRGYVRHVDPPFEDDAFFHIVNPCSDWGFKKSLGSHEEGCAAFINAVLAQEDRVVEDVIFLNKEQPSQVPIGSHFTIDVVARDHNGQHFLIEMQNDFHAYYPDEARIRHARFEGNLDMLYVHNQLALEAWEKTSLRKNPAKDFQKSLVGVHSIVVTNKPLDSGFPDVVNTSEYRHINHPDIPYSRQSRSTLTVLALDRFDKGEDDLETHQDRFFFFLKYMSLRNPKAKMSLFKKVSKSSQVTDAEGTPLYKLHEMLDKRKLREGELTNFVRRTEEAEEVIDHYRAQGRAQGREQGRVQGKLEAAIALLETGMHTKEEVASMLNLDIADVDRALHNDEIGK